MLTLLPLATKNWVFRFYLLHQWLLKLSPYLQQMSSVMSMKLDKKLIAFYASTVSSWSTLGCYSSTVVTVVTLGSSSSSSSSDATSWSAMSCCSSLVVAFWSAFSSQMLPLRQPPPMLPHGQPEPSFSQISLQSQPGLSALGGGGGGLDFHTILSNYWYR